MCPKYNFRYGFRSVYSVPHLHKMDLIFFYLPKCFLLSEMEHYFLVQKSPKMTVYYYNNVSFTHTQFL